MNDVDVLIVGGGPGGSSCAWRLRQLGVDCLVLDAEAFPRLKLCAGWITPEVVRNLEVDPATYPHRLLTFDRIHVHVGPLHFAMPTRQHSIRRFEFDAWLLERSGAPVEQHEVRSIRREGQWYVIDERYRSHWLVGAGGTRCPVYRELFRRASPRLKRLQTVTLEEEFPYPYEDESCHLWFFEKGLPGYSWYVPKRDGWLNIGIGGLKTRLQSRGGHIREHWDRLITRLGRTFVPQHDFSPRGYSYYVRGPAAVGRIDNAFLVGDAAGLATRDLCEGIGPAVSSGLRAAESIAKGEPYDLERIERLTGGRGLLHQALAWRMVGRA